MVRTSRCGRDNPGSTPGMDFNYLFGDKTLQVNLSGFFLFFSYSLRRGPSLNKKTVQET